MPDRDPQRIAFGGRLAAARKRAGLSGEQVASNFSYKGGKKTVSQWETGRGVPDALVLRTLCRLYDVSADALLWEQGAEAPGALLPPPLARKLSQMDPTRRASALQILDSMLALGDSSDTGAAAPSKPKRAA